MNLSNAKKIRDEAVAKIEAAEAKLSDLIDAAERAASDVKMAHREVSIHRAKLAMVDELIRENQK